MVTEPTAHERVAHLAAARDHERAAQLQGISSDASGPKAPQPGASEPARGGRSRAVEEVAAEHGRAVADELGIDDDAADGTAAALEELSRLLDGAVADQHQLRASRADLLVDAAQLRDLLVAEDSAEVAQEDQHHVVVLP
jgi:hypothetical protein